MTESIRQSLDFQDFCGRKVLANFKGGNVSANSGVLLLREIDARTGLSQEGQHLRRGLSIFDHLLLIDLREARFKGQ